MQFIPSTWTVVGVDGDGDGRRDPQDVDDAALGTAVYLCSGSEDLSTTAGQRAAVHRYNHSDEYVDLVLSFLRAYAGGDYTAVPTSTAGATTLDADPAATRPARRAHHHGHRGSRPTGSSAPAGQAAGGSAPSTPGSGSSASGGTGSGGTGGSGSGSGDGGLGGAVGAVGVVGAVGDVTDGVTHTAEPVVGTLSAGAEAVAFCADHLPDLGSLGDAGRSTVVDRCAAGVVGLTPDQAARAVPATLGGVLSWLGLSLGDLLP